MRTMAAPPGLDAERAGLLTELTYWSDDLLRHANGVVVAEQYPHYRGPMLMSREPTLAEMRAIGGPASNDLTDVDVAILIQKNNAMHAANAGLAINGLQRAFEVFRGSGEIMPYKQARWLWAAIPLDTDTRVEVTATRIVGHQVTDNASAHTVHIEGPSAFKSLRFQHGDRRFFDPHFMSLPVGHELFDKARICLPGAELVIAEILNGDMQADELEDLLTAFDQLQPESPAYQAAGAVLHELVEHARDVHDSADAAVESSFGEPDAAQLSSMLEVLSSINL